MAEVPFSELPVAGTFIAYPPDCPFTRKSIYLKLSDDGAIPGEVLTGVILYHERYFQPFPSGELVESPSTPTEEE